MHTMRSTRTTLGNLRRRSPHFRTITPHPQSNPTRQYLTLSSVSGPTNIPLATETLSEYFTNTVLRDHASRPALIARKELARAHGGPPSRNLGRDGKNAHLAWDFAEFDAHIQAVARGLIAMGVQRDDRVGVIMGNNSSYACLQWACARVGAILVTLNPAYRLHELVSVLALAKVKHLFVVPRVRSSAYVSMLSTAFPDLAHSQPGEIQAEALPALLNLVVVNNPGVDEPEDMAVKEVKSVIDWREFVTWNGGGVEDRKISALAATLHRDEVANLQFTSGTTGLPKAVSLTHSNLLNNGILIGRSMRLTSQDVLCNVPPLFHCFGLVLGNIAAWSHGSCIVYPSPSFDPKAIVDAVTQERCTALHGVPTHFYGVLAEVEERQKRGEETNTERLRTGIAAGSPIPIELMRRLIDKMGLTELTNAYGMTETSPVSFQTTPEDSLSKRVETVGKIHPHVRAKVVDLQGEVVPVGVPGELHVAGYLLQKGYWEDAETTDKVMKKDEEETLWMHTGDEAIMDEEGYLRIVGRIKDLIIRGGENLFPVQVENVLSTNHAIEESAAVSVPDPRYGEVVGVWIVRSRSSKGAALTRQDVRDTVCAGMNPQNAPAYVWFVGEDGAAGELPKTASGKVQKHVLRGWSKELKERGVGAVGGA